jgi:hypothetical protein
MNAEAKLNGSGSRIHFYVGLAVVTVVYISAIAVVKFLIL